MTGSTASSAEPLPPHESKDAGNAEISTLAAPGHALRYGGAEDVEACVALWREAILRRDGATADPAGLELQIDRLRENFRLPGGILLLAEDSAGQSGFALLIPQADGPSGYLSLLAVAPRAQGRGIAQSLLSSFTQARRAAGDRWLVLRVLEDNRAAQQLYRKLGWFPFGPLEPHEVTGKPFQWYKLLLS
ncbi:GNAT family N-acetyltransferase [Psychromicrobium sp. YIM B11713]|uniref:GNAT family N-acetyltransferase n=1 Tax=Psychromicrobium sp. YIM B11713 TaxID=3145233 RepID=UPI00374F62CF